MSGTNANLETRITTDTLGGSRDLMLGLTNDQNFVGFPGMVAMSKIGPEGGPPSLPQFFQSDLFGTWRVYIQRVEAKLSGSTTQIGRTTFGPTGIFVNGQLVDAGVPPITSNLTSGGLTVASNGSVVGALAVGTAPTADRYSFIGSMRGAKDLITGVLTAELSGRTLTHYGLVTMVRDVTLFDLGQASYTMAEGNTGNTLNVTVKRTGNLMGTAGVSWEVTAPPGVLMGPTSGTLAFGANAPSMTFPVKTAPNVLLDGNKSATITLSNPTGLGAVLGSVASAPLTILDDENAGTFKLSATSYPIGETGKNANITIQRANGNVAGIVVQFVTIDGTAQAGRDYTASNSSVTFSATETSKIVQVPILDTKTADGPRTFTFQIMPGPPAAAGTPTSATVTIADNDTAGTLQFSAATYVETEPAMGANKSAVITITRMGTNLADGVTVDFSTANGTATAGADYAATTQTITFGAGNVSRTVSIPIFADSLIEGDETVRLILSNPGGGIGAALGALKNAVLTIKDGQKGLQFTSSNYSVAESVATASITVVRTGPLNDAATVRFSTSDGTGQANVNYLPASGTLSFGPTIATQSFPVKILPDKLASGPKTVLLLLSSANSSVAPPVGLGPRNTAVLTIGDTEKGGTIKLSAATYSGTEASGIATVTITRAGGTAGAVTVDYATSDQPCASPPCPGLAQAGQDYEASSGTLTFGPTETTKVVQIPITNDPTVEGPETFLFTLSNVQGGAALVTPFQAVVTIVDNDQGGVVQLAGTTFSVSEPASGNISVNVKVTRTGSNLADGASVVFLTGVGTAVPGLNYASVASTLVFDLGETEKLVPITVFGDGGATGNLTVPILLTSPAGGLTLGATKSGVLNITDANRSVRFSAPLYSVNEGGTATVGVLRGGSPLGTVNVRVSTTDDTATTGVDYTSKVTTLTFGPNIMSLPFTVTTAKRAGDTGNRSVALTLDNASAGVTIVPQNPATLVIQDVDGAGTFQFSPASYSVTEGGSVMATVTRTGGVGGQVTLNWTSNGSAVTDFTPASGILTFLAGQASRPLTVMAVNNAALDGNRSFLLSLGTPSAGSLGDQATAVLQIRDNDIGGTIQMAAAALPPVAENIAGGIVKVGVTRTGTGLAGGVLVDYTVSGNTSAIASPLSGTLTFATPAQTTGTISLTLAGSNPVAQLDRNVLVTLSNPRSSNGFFGPNGPKLGTLTNTSVKIIDTLPHVQFTAAGFGVVEGGAATIGVSRTGTGTGPVTVQYQTIDGGTAQPGVDYVPTSNTLTVTTGAPKTFTVQTLPDGALNAGPKTVFLGLSNAVGASIGEPAVAVLTLADKDSAGTVQFMTPAASVVEGGSATITVTRGGANLVGGVTVGWSVTGGTATGDDFSPSSGALTFGPGETSQTFPVDTVADGVPEGTQSLVLSLDAPTGGAALGSPAQMTVFVIDEQQTVGFAAPAVNVGETTPAATVQVSRSGIPSGTVTVQVTTVDGTANSVQDYVSTTTTLTFGPGDIVKPFVVPIRTQNATTRSGNRQLSLVLSNPSANAALNAANASTLTILDFRPDLVIASVSAPGEVFTGKSVSTPSTVKNLGPVPAPAFKIGIFMVRADAVDVDPLAPGAGSLVATQDVSGLAPGASASFPTQVNIDDSFPSGNYYLSAVANFGLNVAEADTANNGLSSAPTAIAIKKNLTKFKSANAAFSQTSPPEGSSAGFGPLAGQCDAEGSVNLTGTFSINAQSGDTAIGQASLTGTLNDSPVQYVLLFSGTGDDNGNITAVLNSVTFKSLTSPLAGSGSGSLVGTLDGRTLTATVSGQFTTNTGGACIFNGTLQAQAQTSFQFGFGAEANVGSFGFDTTPTVSFPVGVSNYFVGFRAFFDSDFPQPRNVLFTGPAGSGVMSVPASEEDISDFQDGNQAEYFIERSGTAPGGKWSVLYKGLPRSFTVPPFNGNTSLVVIFPTAIVEPTSGLLTRVDWVYKNRLNGSVITPPSFISRLRVSVQVSQNLGPEIQAEFTGATNQSFDFGPFGFMPVPWAQVSGLEFHYTDLAGNEYELNYSKSFSVAVQTRLENNYGGDGFYPPTGSRERLLTAWVNVPHDGIDPQATCSIIVENGNGTRGLAPFDDPTCIGGPPGVTVFPDGFELVDLWSSRVVLNPDNPANGPTFPTQVRGTPFTFDITPDAAAPIRVTTSLANDELTEFIEIPNPATPTLKPSGGRLADAKLGQNQTISWTKPTSFPIRDVFVSANVYNGNGQFCSSPQPPVTVDSTQATFRFLSSCFGQAPQQANVCVFYTGTADEQTAACWFFFNGGSGGPQLVQLQNGTATHSEMGFTPDQVVDNNFDFPNGWAIRDGNPTPSAQTAVWETATSVSGGTLIFQMFFRNDLFPDHGLGRFRLSVTSDDRSLFANGADIGGDVTANWTPLTQLVSPGVQSTPVQMFGNLPDGTLVATMPPTGTDTVYIYTIYLQNPLSNVTGIRLETFKDMLLPSGGPGLASDGNFLLTELTLIHQP